MPKDNEKNKAKNKGLAQYSSIYQNTPYGINYYDEFAREYLSDKNEERKHKPRNSSKSK